MSVEEWVFFGLTLVILVYASVRVLREGRYTERIISEMRKERERKEAERVEEQIRNLRNLDNEEDT